MYQPSIRFILITNSKVLSLQHLQPSKMKKSYVQASKSNISQKVEDVLQLKEAFPSLSADEVGKILKVKDSGEGNKKPRINMTTRGPLRREVIIPMTKVNTELIVNSAHIHISNINNCLKNSKSDIIADFIQININGIIITTNKPANNLNLSTIEKYLKNIKNINPDSIESPCLPKSKSYMKIIGLLYSSKLEVITPNLIKGVLKDLYLFKNTVLASKSCVIKASPKSDKAVVVRIKESGLGFFSFLLISFPFSTFFLIYFSFFYF